MTNSRNKIKSIFSTLILIVCVSYILIKCLEENTTQELTFSELKTKYYLSILKSQATKFDFQYDQLTPQESYMSNCKLKFLTLKISGELTNIERLIEFENDSIKRILTRKTIYVGKANGKEAGRDWITIENDSVFVLDYKRMKKEIYKKSKLIKTIEMKKKDENEMFIYKVKSQTEKEYNGS